MLAAALAIVGRHSSWFGSGTPAPRLSIVVLPFTNLSADRDQQYFADAITEDLTTDLSRLPETFVISAYTALSYRGRLVDARQVGRELGVRYIIEGSVQRIGSRVGVNAQLIDAASAAHLWAERFEYEIKDFFDVQSEIARRIAIALNVRLLTKEASRRTVNPDGLDLILRGRAVMNKPKSRSTYAEAISYFERALALDPGSVDGQSFLAISLAGRVIDFFSESEAADMGRAAELAARAVSTAPDNAAAHFAKATVLRGQRRCQEAIHEYEVSLGANPSWVDALAAIGRCKIYLGPIEEGITAVEQALRLSPRDPNTWIWYFRIGEGRLLQGRLGEAVDWLERARNTNPAPGFVHLYLASAYALAGLTPAAAAELAEARKLGVSSSIALLQARQHYETPEVRALANATYFAGLRKAGMPED